MYGVVLFGHLVGVVLLAGGVIITLSSVLRAQRGATVAEVRAALASAPVAGRLIPPGMALIVGCGVYLWSRHGDDHSIAWTAPWLITAAAVFVVMSVLGPAVEETRTKRIAAAAAAAPDGPVSAELDRLRCDRLLHHVIFFGSAQIVALLFLMSVKPEVTGTLVTIAVAAVVSQVIAALVHPHMRPATATAVEVTAAEAAVATETP